MTNDKQPILSICIPTYNKSAVLFEDVKRYLSISDARFCVRVCDNASSDRTCEKLSNIKDNRLFIYKNENNIGGPANVMKSLQCADSEYVLLVLDKDAVSIEYLSAFIDTIEQYKPQWGMVNLSAKEPEAPAIISHGLDAIRNSSTYAPKHPSGFLVKSSLYNHFLATDWSKIETEKCKFPLELCQLYLAINYDMTIVNLPLIIDGNSRGSNVEKSYSYTASNCWFFYDARANYYEIFAKLICQQSIDINVQKVIIKEMTMRLIDNVSKLLHIWMQSPNICEHYHIKTRYVSLFEMNMNVYKALSIYKKIALQYSIYDKSFAIKSFFRNTYKNFKFIIKEYIKGKTIAVIKIG